MIYRVKFIALIVLNVCVIYANSHTAQKTNSKTNDDSNPFLDIATSFLQETFANQQNGRGGGSGIGANGIAGIAQLIGSLVQQDGSKSNHGGNGGGGLGAAQILTGISQLMNSANGGGSGSGGFDPSIIGNVIEMFTGGGGGGDDDNDVPQMKRKKRANHSAQDGGIGIDTILNIASAFMGNTNNVDNSGDRSGEGLMSLLPMAIQAINSFSGPEGEKTQAKHKDHQWVLPPFLERIHVLWDHFSNSELAEALWEKSGINQIFKVSKQPKSHDRSVH